MKFCSADSSDSLMNILFVKTPNW